MVGVTGWICLVLLVCMLNASFTIGKLLFAKGRKNDQLDEASRRTSDSIIHVFLMAAYKEPIDVILKTVESIKSQTKAKQILFVVAFEERTPEFDSKCAAIRTFCDGAFLDIIFTRHPYGVEGEIPGKCSNANFAAREAVRQLKQKLPNLDSLDNCLFTTCDTDNLFPTDYCQRLGEEFVRCEKRHEVIWQPPLFYNYDLDKRPFFVRVTGIIRMVFVIGMLIPQNINAMSIYSMSVNLLIRGNYFHPSYQFVDAIDNLVRMIAIGGVVPLKMLPCPVISGPTSGANLAQEASEWARQAWRWTIGCAEIFHVFCIKSRQLSFWSALAYGFAFTHYYGFILCSMALISLTGLISTNVFDSVGICSPADYLPHELLYFVPLMGIGFAYCVFAWCFLLDKLATRCVLDVNEHICPIRNLLHWISSPFVLLDYSMVGYYAIAEVAIRGKKVCTHGASKKGALAV